MGLRLQARICGFEIFPWPNGFRRRPSARFPGLLTATNLRHLLSRMESYWLQCPLLIIPSMCSVNAPTTLVHRPGSATDPTGIVPAPPPTRHRRLLGIAILRAHLNQESLAAYPPSAWHWTSQSLTFPLGSNPRYNPTVPASLTAGQYGGASHLDQFQQRRRIDP